MPIQNGVLTAAGWLAQTVPEETRREFTLLYVLTLTLLAGVVGLLLIRAVRPRLGTRGGRGRWRGPAVSAWKEAGRRAKPWGTETGLEETRDYDGRELGPGDISPPPPPPPSPPFPRSHRPAPGSQAPPNDPDERTDAGPSPSEGGDEGWDGPEHGRGDGWERDPDGDEGDGRRGRP